MKGWRSAIDGRVCLDRGGFAGTIGWLTRQGVRHRGTQPECCDPEEKWNGRLPSLMLAAKR